MPTTTRKKKLIAFHGDPKIKAKYLTRVRAHRKADQLIQGYGYWSDGKGCAVGCSIHGDDHSAYETELGVPERLAHLEDAIFEGLPKDNAKQWPELFFKAITPGADLSLVWNRFAVWLLRESKLLTITDINREAIERAADLHQRVIDGKRVTHAQWSSARSAANAARSAADAAGAARSAADAAGAAWSAAWGAAWSTARSAARSAANAARSAAWILMSRKLLSLMKEAPVK